MGVRAYINGAVLWEAPKAAKEACHFLLVEPGARLPDRANDNLPVACVKRFERGPGCAAMISAEIGGGLDS